VRRFSKRRPCPPFRDAVRTVLYTARYS
jgi:hypothetical protein